MLVSGVKIATGFSFVLPMIDFIKYYGPTSDNFVFVQCINGCLYYTQSIIIMIIMMGVQLINLFLFSEL